MKKTELGSVIIYSCALIEIIAILQILLSSGPIGYGIIGLLVVPVIILLLFYKLVIVVTEEKIKLSFGIGLIQKSFPLTQIINVTSVRNSILTGWGIRFTSDFTLYNVSGLNAIELTFKNSRRKVRIGTNFQDAFLIQIKKQIAI